MLNTDDFSELNDGKQQVKYKIKLKKKLIKGIGNMHYFVNERDSMRPRVRESKETKGYE